MGMERFAAPHFCFIVIFVEEGFSPDAQRLLTHSLGILYENQIVFFLSICILTVSVGLREIPFHRNCQPVLKIDKTKIGNVIFGKKYVSILKNKRLIQPLQVWKIIKVYSEY